MKLIGLLIFSNLCISAPNFILSSQLKQDSLAINLAGRQRMLSQRMVKALLILENNYIKGEEITNSQNELSLTYQLFDQTLEGFTSGKMVISANQEPVFLKPVDSKQAQQLVQEARAIWFSYRQALQPIINDRISTEILTTAIAYATREKLNLLDVMNQLTVELENQAKHKALILQIFQGVSLIFALLIISRLLYLQQLKRKNEKLKLSKFKLEKKTQELEQALKQLKQTQTQLVQSEKMFALGKLVAGIAHEINNPINFIQGNINCTSENVQDLLSLVQLYQKYYPNSPEEIQLELETIDFNFLQEDLPKLLASMQKGTGRVQKIVQSLRTFSRLDESELKDVDIHEGIDSSLMLVQHRLNAENNGFTIEVVKEYQQLPRVTCYPGQLNQVFMHILNNAIDVLEERWKKHQSLDQFPVQTNTPQVDIRTESVNSQQVRITIADNGCGIKKEILPHIFDPFFTTKPVGQATGLGLGISYQVVVEKHRGQLISNSVLGQGTELTIEIPVKQS